MTPVNSLVRIGKNEVFQFQHSDQPSVLIRHRDRVDCGHVRSSPADRRQCFLDAHARPQREEFGIHDPPGRLRRVAEQQAGHVLFVLAQPGENTPNHGRGHLLKQPGTVVGLHRFDQLADLVFSQCLNQLLLIDRLKLLEDFARRFLRQQPECSGALDGLKVLQLADDLHCVGLREPLLKRLCFSSRFDHRPRFLQPGLSTRGSLPSLPGVVGGFDPESQAARDSRLVYCRGLMLAINCRNACSLAATVFSGP